LADRHVAPGKSNRHAFDIRAIIILLTLGPGISANGDDWVTGWLIAG
jgi:hypothetical protein